MSTPPTPKQIAELVAFLPQLYGPGFKAIPDDTAQPWPQYHPVVEEFFRVAGQEQWRDAQYQPTETGRMLQNSSLVKTASLEQVKTMLTYCVRGERFSDGHWSNMIEQGHVRRLLERLVELAKYG